MKVKTVIKAHRLAMRIFISVRATKRSPFVLVVRGENEFIRVMSEDDSDLRIRALPGGQAFLAEEAQLTVKQESARVIAKNIRLDVRHLFRRMNECSRHWNATKGGKVT